MVLLLSASTATNLNVDVLFITHSKLHVKSSDHLGKLLLMWAANSMIKSFSKKSPLRCVLSIPSATLLNVHVLIIVYVTLHASSNAHLGELSMALTTH